MSQDLTSRNGALNAGGMKKPRLSTNTGISL